ncbi:MAG: AarF/ABC1/UbiB kinase family protein [Paracoccaceae bacterium]
MTAGIAGNMAANGLAQLGKRQRPNMRDLLLTPTNITRVADQLAQMRGAAMKIGQLMSMDSGEVLPLELTQIMARLRDDAHFMPPSQLKQVLNSEWQKGWLQSFQAFDVHPIAAASIGQVHRAQLKDGRDLAIKVQYPGVAKSIDSDVANVGALMRISGLLPKGFELGPYLQAAQEQLHEETDYAREGQCLSRFGVLVKGAPEFAVPELCADWSTRNILAMSFVGGVPIEQAENQSQEKRDQIATRLINLTLKEIFSFGVMQTDPNFANYLYDPESGRIVLLDFGATRDIDPVVVDQYRRIMQFGLAENIAGLAEVSEEIGFFDETTSRNHRDQIINMIVTVFRALSENRPFDFANNALSREMQTKGQALAEDGFIPPPVPIDILLLQRKFGGMFLLAKKLRARVDVVALLEAQMQ